MYGDRTAADMRQPSVQLAEEWPLALDVDMSNLSNFVADVEEAEDLQFAGALETVNPKFTRVTPRNPLSLDKFDNRQHFTATTSEDPIMQQLMQQKAGNVYATDAILVRTTHTQGHAAVCARKRAQQHLPPPSLASLFCAWMQSMSACGCNSYDILKDNNSLET